MSAPYFMVTIQHAADTGRFHPTLYRESPSPGSPRADTPLRYRSEAHHIEGFLTLPEARTDAQRLLQHYGLSSPQSGVLVEQVESAGPNVVLIPSGWSET